jgi:hypothetical protein
MRESRQAYPRNCRVDKLQRPVLQSNHPVPRRTLVCYFEVTVKEARGGSVSLGFSDSSFKQGRHPG